MGCPIPETKLPGFAGKHRGKAVFGEKVPTAHGWGAVKLPPGQKEPAGHCVHW